MLIYNVGCKVEFGEHEGIITGCMISGYGYIEYRINYWFEGEYNEVFLQPYEISTFVDKPKYRLLPVLSSDTLCES